MVMDSPLFVTLQGLLFGNKEVRPSNPANKGVGNLDYVVYNENRMHLDSHPVCLSMLKDSIGVSIQEKSIPLGDVSLPIGDILQKSNDLVGVDSHLGLPNEGGTLMNSAKPTQEIGGGFPQGEFDPFVHGFDMLFVATDESLIFEVQKLVSKHNNTLNHDVTGKVVDVIDQDLAKLNSSLFIPLTCNPFEILSLDKALDCEDALSKDNKVGFDPVINKPLVQTPLSPSSPLLSPAKRGRKPKAFYT